MTKQFRSDQNMPIEPLNQTADVDARPVGKQPARGIPGEFFAGSLRTIGWFMRYFNISFKPQRFALAACAQIYCGFPVGPGTAKNSRTGKAVLFAA
jgi:hypothetical protein